jgi:hypothetical protein
LFAENLKPAIPSVNLVGMVIMHDRKNGLGAAQIILWHFGTPVN